MIPRLFLLELRAIRSDGRLLVLTAIAAAMLLLSVWIGADSQRIASEGRSAAVEISRKQWESLDAMTPHSAGHFGSYVYKPSGTLSTLDSGVMPFTGKVVRVEAHRQSPPAHSDASTWSSLVRLGAFDAGTILAHILPLLLAFTAFASVARDRETGLLRVLAAQGVRLRTILWGKAFAYWSLALGLVVTLIATHIAIDLRSGGVLSADIAARLACFGVFHAVHLLVVVLVAVWISARVPDARAALALLMITWLGATVLLPRVTAQLGSQLFPLDSQVTFEDSMKEDRAKGLDGHDPADERRVALQERILAEHGAKHRGQLPINPIGILMQADEEYGNRVWDEHFGRRHDTVRKQIGVMQVASFLNPFLAARGLSMAFAGTDQFHDAQFQRQAEDYRREMVRTLNDLDANAGKRAKNGKWIREKVDFAEIADFRFEPQTIGFALGNRWPELVSLLLWLVAAAALVQFGLSRIPVVGTGR